MFSLIIQLSGIFFGVFARTSLPFFRKLYQGKIKSFKIRYCFQGIGAFFLSLFFSFLIFPQYSLETKGNIDWFSSFKLFCISFAFGFGFNSLVNEAGEWLQNGRKN